MSAYFPQSSIVSSDPWLRHLTPRHPMRPLITMEQLRTLATTWSTRLQENSRRPQPDEMSSIFAGLGLEGDFWDPKSDSFG